MSTNTDDIISGGLFAPIQPLKLNDTFYSWYLTTNSIIDALNPLAIYDVASGPGIDITKITGGVAVISIKTGCGLRFDSGVSLCLDISGTPEATQVQSEDYFIFEGYNGTNITTDSSDCETLYKIQATNILPYVVSGDHDFVGGDTSSFKVSSDFFVIDSSTVDFKTQSIYLNNNTVNTNEEYAERSEIVFSGISVHANDEVPTFGYVGSLLAWKSNQNLSVDSDKAFVSDSSGDEAIFNFSTKTVDQRHVSIKMLTGSRDLEGDLAKIFTINADYFSNTLKFSFYNQYDTFSSDTEMFSVYYDETENVSHFNIDGTLYIRDISESTQFLTESDYTTHKVPLTNGFGVLDHKFTNRYVTSKYDPSIEVGDLVRFEYSSNTNTTEDIEVVAAQANSEENSKVIGIVEQIAGGEAIIALTGVFEYNGESVNITSGDVYYLSPSNPGLATKIKPESGIIKEVFVGIGPAKGVLLTSGVTKEPFFGKVQISGGSLVESESSGDTLILKGGTNVNLQYTSNNEIQINAGSLYNANYWSMINTDDGSPSRIESTTNDDSFYLLGGNGISTESYVNSNNESTITVNAPNSYGNIQIIGENTDELDYLVSASSGSDTLIIRSGTGINITSTTNNDILIEALGVSVPANRSVGNSQLSEMPAFSIKGAQANGDPIDIFQVQQTIDITYPVLADYYDVYYNTDGDRVFRDPVSFEEYPSIYSEVLEQRIGTGTPDAVAGYVYGRVVDEFGSVSEIKPLNRQELRLLLGASETGFLEENNKLFSSWSLFDYTDLINNISSSTAEGKSGILKFVAGVGIELENVTASGTDAIKITATGTNASFGSVYNTTTSESLYSSVVGDSLNISERDAVGIDLSSNNNLDFYIKLSSITNEMLSEMSENTVKVGVSGTNSTTNGSTPTDLYIDENEILGRPVGEGLKSLSSSEVRSILGLSSSTYYKSFSCYTGNTNVGTGNSSYNEELVFVGGTNIALTVLPNKSIKIDALTDSDMYGIKTVGFTDTGLIYTATHLLFEELSLNSAYGVYKNIDIDYSFNSTTGTLTTAINMGVMPQRSVKIAGTNYNAMKGGYVPSNLVIQPGHVLGVLNSGTSLTSIPFSTLVQTSGLNYFSSAVVGSTVVPASGASALRFAAAGDASVYYQGNQIIFSSTSTLQSDTTPSLGGDLELYSHYFKNNNKKSLQINNLLGSISNHYLSITNTAGTVEFAAVRDTSTVSSIDLKLTPYGTGSVVTNKISSSILSNLTLKSNAGTVYFDSNTISQTILSSTGAKHLCLSPGESIYDVKMIFNNGTTTREIVNRRINNDTAIIHSSLSGNLILCAGYAGTGISTGSTSIQMNSDVLMNTVKSIRSVDNVVKINTTDSGYLKLLGTTNSVAQKIFTLSFDSDVTRVIDNFKTNIVGNSLKYIIRGQNPGNLSDMFILEFNVLVTPTEEIAEIVSVVYPSTAPTNTQNVSVSVSGDGTDIEVSLNTIVNDYTLTVYRTSLI